MSSRPKPPVVQPGVSSILVSPVQRGNPLLSHIRHVAYQFAEIVPDFQVGTTACVIFLSLKYHRLHPEYIHGRIEKLQGMYGLRILLLMCDVTEHQNYIRELTRVCLINQITIMVAWTLEEAGVYLSTYKMFEHKPPDLIKERSEKDHNSILTSVLTSIKSVNKTDVMTLRSNFGSFSDIVHATPEQLLACPGFGNLKVRRFKDTVDKPFRPAATARAVTGSISAPFQDPEASTSSKIAATRQQRPEREKSPDWPEFDIELDLN